MVKKIILGIIIFLLVIGILRGLFSDSNKTDTQLAYSDLSDFEYEILDNTINLKKYKKHDKKIIINETYNIDGSDYTVTHIEDAIFNGSSANVVYIPKTITCVYDNTLAYLGADHIDLYYAGPP